MSLVLDESSLLAVGFCDEGTVFVPVGGNEGIAPACSIGKDGRFVGLPPGFIIGPVAKVFGVLGSTEGRILKRSC